MVRITFVIIVLISTIMASVAAPKVVVSIAPIHSLVANVMQGVGKPELLVNGLQSPHHFSLKPAQVQKIKDADLIIWVGDILETFLIKPINSFDKQECALIKAPKLHVLNIRGKPCEHSCAHGALIDPHIWLDIQNAIVMVDAIVTCLSKIDERNTTQYEHNGVKVKARLNNLEKEILDQALEFKGLKFICVHDAFHYYEQMVGVSNVGVLASVHSLEPSLKHLSDLKTIVKDKSVMCAFSEPQSQSKVLNVLAQEFNLYRGIIDPLGADIEPGVDQYFLLLKKITTAFTNCLKNKHGS
jgi:zinc transport system substrate-binding protein